MSSKRRAPTASACSATTTPKDGSDGTMSGPLRPRRATFARFGAFLAARFRSPIAYWPALACGGLSGVYLLSWGHQLPAMLGTSLAMVVALSLSVALGCEWGWRTPTIPAEQRGRALRVLGTLQFAMAGWTVAFPWLLGAVVSTAGLFSLESLADPVRGLLFQWAAALFLLPVAVALVIRVPAALPAFCAETTGPGTTTARAAAATRWYLCGVMGGLLVDVFVLSPLFGVQAAALAAAVCGIACFLVCLLHSDRFTDTAADAPPTARAENETSAADRAISLESDLSRTIWAQLSILALGGLTALLGRVAHQLVPAVSSVVYVEWAAVVVGFVLGWAVSDRVQAAHGNRAVWCAGSTLFAAGAAAIVLAAFPLLVDACLAANAYISHAWLLSLIRSGVVAAIVLPAGIAWGAAVADGTGSSTGLRGWRRSRVTETAPRVESRIPLRPPLRALTFVAGFVGVRAILLSSYGTARLLCVAIAALAALAAARFVMTRTFPRTWPARGLAAAALATVVTGLFLSDSYQPARAARLLFSTNVFVAKQSGTSSEMLDVLDEGRIAKVFEGDRGTYTLWKYRGVQFQLRESGVPKGVFSTNTTVCPHYSAEVMTAVMPLVMHESPRRVLLLGLGSGTGLATCLDFPVQELTCADADSQLFRLLDDVVWPAAGIDPLSDIRLRCCRIDPALALASRAGEYEVIISNPDQSALAQATPHFTRQFYRQAARSLTVGGIFCQRFQQIDYGPDPLCAAIESLKGVFQEVAAVESAPGEIVLLATNAPAGIVREGLEDRLQRPHVRWTLSQLGWDWVIPLNLPAYPHAALADMSVSRPNRPNTVANGSFAFRLPADMMRWGAKWQERHAALSPHGTRLVAWHDADGGSPLVRRRLEEVTGQRKLIARAVDQPWAYRKQLRDAIQKRPRSAIERVAFQPDEGRLHPEDERRIAYLKALGEAARQPEPDDDQILELAEFARPYDPIISFFVHHEIAQLYGRSPQHDRSAELAHRLHTVYFVDGNDRSVRNVVAAINLLVEHPDAVAGPLAQWDHLNALLQVLKGRWDARRSPTTTSTRILLNDVEKSITALETSLASMDQLQSELDLPEADWRIRRLYIEQSLIRPLRTYRTRLLPRHLSQEKSVKKVQSASASEATADGELPDEFGTGLLEP